MKSAYNKNPVEIIRGKHKKISVFSTEGNNIDPIVVKGFGDEWLKFKDFSDAEIAQISAEYFDILDDNILTPSTYAVDIGCGSGRWTKALSRRVGFVEAIDPSNAVISAEHLLKEVENVRITKASVETIPFDDETFDFAMSVGVLHHIPDTQKAMVDCVKKVKKGGYFFTYLYYNFETRPAIYKTMYFVTNGIRNVVSKMPSSLKKFSCDILAITTYMPVIGLGRIMNAIGLKKAALKLPLSEYQARSFFVIRNDAMDRYGTTFDQRFSKEEVITMMKKSGLENIVVSPISPFYHAVGRKPF
ncbi:bifunctional 2-polyprenyl-6-hydroxyphenol methylase/3-demethylubiquinol 3-O-methyltransferase UbiG [Ferruginibacter sp.]|uniref:class I SAM-dependent methyltransferase n=1 Tax=Ferruginibacter sp. TaxID=1940288 RepID=UPI0019910B09|nr:class I SAM-dependent methyltransferase [Ferruginibacter sp.]MBC7629002.1 methyltransferase domain-containing protein [Ferruginibacter sp.]